MSKAGIDEKAVEAKTAMVTTSGVGSALRDVSLDRQV